MIQMLLNFLSGRWIWIVLLLGLLGFVGIEYYKKELIEKELEMLKMQNKKLEDITMTTIGVNANNSLMFEELKELMSKNLTELSDLLKRHYRIELELKKLKEDVKNAKDGDIAPSLRTAINGVLQRTRTDYNKTSRASEATNTKIFADSPTIKHK